MTHSPPIGVEKLSGVFMNFGFYPTPMCVTLCTRYLTSSVRTDTRHITLNIQIAKVLGWDHAQRNVPVIFFTELGESSKYTVLTNRCRVEPKLI